MSLLLFGFSAFLGFAASCELYPKIEASFAVTNLASDPFDYVATDVRVQITQPDSMVVSLPAFFDGGTLWRVRHSPPLAGLYQVTGITLNGLLIPVSNLQPGSWNVQGVPSSSGFVRVDPSNTNRFITANGRRYFPLGQNLAWDTSAATNVVGLMAKLGASHENWSRVWMDHWDGKNLDWPKVGSTFGTLSLTVARKWDAIVSAAEQSGVSFQMTLQHHGQYSTSTDPNWPQNPYNTTNGGFLSDPKLFFTDATARALTKRKLRYAVARWGYSPAIMGWELFNEVQFTDAAQNGQWTNVAAWHDEMAQFIRSQDVYQHLITTSSQLDQNIWNQCDYYQHHDYPTDLISNLQDPAGVPAGQPAKPIYGGECGMDNTPYYGLHAPIWAGLMGGQSGAEQQWYWDHIDGDNAYGLFKAARDFVLLSGLGEQNAVARSAPHVTCAQNTSLVFSPGGGWSSATQDTFTVGDSAPDGIGTLPSYLQGNYHRPMTPNGFTFLVNYPASGGTFSAQVVTIATSGAGLQIFLDGTLANSASWPANTNGDISTNFTLSISVPAGAHTLKLWDPGLDWVNLGNLTFNPYAPMLGAYQLANTNFAALWIWHRTNIYSTNATITINGTLPLAGLQPGSYAGTWWDTFAGVALSNFNFSVTDTNPVTVAIPPVLRSVAFFAGLPSHATVVAPLLIQTLATNSSALRLPLVTTNSGGLPLSWSLSVTGANQVFYSAMTSAQPGGPVFAWHDISAIGRDITGTFTALGPKNRKDEGIAGPIGIGFNFPFFSGGQTPDLFNQLYVSPNGYITFSPFSGDTSTNLPLPNVLAPSNSIALFWDDLDLTGAGAIYCATDSISGTFTVEWLNAPIKGTGGNVTCQVILKTSGEILMQYQSLGFSNTCTVGVQNAARNQGPQVAYNQNFLQSGMAVRMRPAAWLGPSASAGLVPGAKADNVTLTLDPTGLVPGNYAATLLAQTSDPAQALTVLPVNLNVLLPIDLWRLNHFGSASNSGPGADSADPDHDGLCNLVEYALGRDPNSPDPNPLSFSLKAGHMSVSYQRPHPAPPDVNYIAEVSGSLAPAVWNSGPAYTSQAVIDNGNGSETVTVTDLTFTGSSAAHYLRVRFSR